MTHSERFEMIRHIVDDECEKIWPALLEGIRARAKESLPGVRVVMASGFGGHSVLSRTGPKAIGPGQVDPLVLTANVDMPIARFEWPAATRQKERE